MKDLFDHVEELPQEMQDLLETIEESLTYDECEALRTKCEALGYTFTSGLDACPIELVKLKEEPKYKPMNAHNYGIDWKNVDLSDAYTRDQNILDPYSFSTLLLEIECNLKEVTPETVRKQAKEAIRAKYLEALEILDNNLRNITTHARKQQKES
jgi:hypothetical protein